MKRTKIISISAKRQITIPLNFYKMLRFSDKAECFIRDEELVIRPVRVSSRKTDEEILTDLIRQNLSGEELLKIFLEQKSKI